MTCNLPRCRLVVIIVLSLVVAVVMAFILQFQGYSPFVGILYIVCFLSLIQVLAMLWWGVR